MLLKDRIALITGAGSGIGQGTAIRFAREGAKLALVDINADSLKETEAKLADTGAEFASYTGDVSVTDDVEGFFKQAIERFGGLDICINNAGIGNPPMPIVQMTDEGFDRTIAVNLRGVFLCMRAAARQMIAQGRGGRIISTSSQAGKTGYPILAPYSATKGAVILLTQALAKELGPFQITVNCVCPGTIDTPLLRGGIEPLANAAGQSFEEFILKSPLPPIVLGRVGYPEDVAKVMTFLASDEADYMTGQAINITGGQEMH